MKYSFLFSLPLIAGIFFYTHMHSMEIDVVERTPKSKPMTYKEIYSSHLCEYMSFIPYKLTHTTRNAYLNEDSVKRLASNQFKTLQKIHIAHKRLEKLQLTFPYLQQLTLEHNSVPEDFDTAQLPNLTSLTLNNNAYSSVNLSGATNLKRLNIQDTPIKTLNLDGLTSLQEAYINECNLTSLSAQDCTSLEKLNLAVNRFKELFLQNLSSLLVFDADENRIANITFKNCNAIHTLHLSKNALTELDLRTIPTLLYLYVKDNLLTTIKLSHPCKLEFGDIRDNKLSDKILKELSPIISLKCDKPVISSEKSYSEEDYSSE